MFQFSQAGEVAFTSLLICEELELYHPTIKDHAAWMALREKSRAHLTLWEDDWTRRETALTAFKRRLRAWERQQRQGVGLSLFARRRADSELVGGATVSNIRLGASRSGILGYWIGAPFVGRGYGAQAVRAVVDHSFDALSLNRLEAACQPENAASRALLTKLGFRHEGLARDYLKINGAWRDHDIFALIARDRCSAAQS
ncbi:MAG: GNAT family protein [Pseudomonadota bacterium]